MTILILHGIGSHAGAHWMQWLHDRLTEQGHQVLMPDLPNPDHPDRSQWLEVVKDAVVGVNPSELIIVGHSLGVPTALDYVESLDKPIKGLVSVAGFYEDCGAELNSYFMAEKNIDMEAVKDKLEQVFVLYGDNDPYVPQPTLKNLSQALGVSPRIFFNGGHLNTDAGYTQFPELLDIVTDIIASETSVTFIDKLAYIHLQNKKLLVTLSKGKDTWYIPGGKRETGETDYEGLIREVKEELNVNILQESIRYYSTFKAQAHGKPKGTIVRMTCYTADFKGDLKPSAEIDKLDYFTYSQKDQTAPVDKLIMDDMKAKGLIE